MNTNAIGGAATQQAPLEKTEAVGSSNGPGNERVHCREEIFRPASIPPLIKQNEIAKHFIRLDSAADLARQGPAQQTGPHSPGGSGPLCQFEGTARSENLRAIVNDDIKWNFFVQSVFLEAPASEATRSMRMGLIKGFETGEWSQAKENPLFDELMQKGTPESPNTDDMKGICKRIDLWLENSDFFKQLFTSVQNGDLNNRPNIITDGLLIDFVLSLPEDPE